METRTKTGCLAHLKRIEGQVRGIAGMVEAERYCIDIITQIQAVRAAITRVEEELLHDHVGHCVEDAIRSGKPGEQRKKVKELVQVLTRKRA